jgi:hypothetical protein
MKIEIKSTKEFIEVVDIQLPKYRKSLVFYYKIFSEDKCIMLETGTTPSISVCPISRAYYSDTIQDCSEADYMAVYHDTLKTILDEKHEL